LCIISTDRRSGRVMQTVGCSSKLESRREPETAKNLVDQTFVREDDEPEEGERDEDACCICLEPLRPSQRPPELLSAESAHALAQQAAPAAVRSFQQRALFVTECGHTMHFGCITLSCKQRAEPEPSCPLCRHKLEEPPARRDAAASVGGGGRPRAAHRQPDPLPRRVVGNGQQARPQIERWRYHFRTGVIKGVVSHYPDHEDGSPISTSPVASGSMEAGGRSICVTGSGSRYLLRAISTGYVLRIFEFPLFLGLYVTYALSRVGTSWASRRDGSSWSWCGVVSGCPSQSFLDQSFWAQSSAGMPWIYF
jgi:hypothetical protein